MKPLAAIFAGALVAAAGVFAYGPQPGGQAPARDTPAQQQAAPPPPSGHISGRVVAADSGRAVKRARVIATAPQLPQGRAALTEDDGSFDLGDLPEGRYIVAASKNGF